MSCLYRKLIVAAFLARAHIFSPHLCVLIIKIGLKAPLEVLHISRYSGGAFIRWFLILKICRKPGKRFQKFIFIVFISSCVRYVVHQHS